MSEASMPRGDALAVSQAGAQAPPRRLAVPLACLLAGVLAFAVPLALFAAPERTFADTLAFAAWAWLLLGLPLLAVLAIGGIRAARSGREPQLLVATRWFAIGLACAVVLSELHRLLFLSS